MLLHQALKGGDSVLRYLWLIPPIDRMLQPTQQPSFPSSPCLPFSFHALLLPSPSLDTLLCTLQEKEGIPPDMTTMKGAQWETEEEGCQKAEEECRQEQRHSLFSHHLLKGKMIPEPGSLFGYHLHIHNHILNSYHKMIRILFYSKEQDILKRIFVVFIKFLVKNLS